MASQIRIISSKATQHLLDELLAMYARTSDQKIVAEAVAGVEASKRARSGEAFDIVVLAANVIDDLMAAGHVVAGSRVDLVCSGVSIAVRSGAPRIDISTVDAVRQAILNAKSVGYSTGPSGVYLTKLFEDWGIAGTIKDRIVQAPPGVPVGQLIAEGKVELGFQQLSELMHLQGIDVLGPLPGEMQIMTIFSAGIAATSSDPQAARQLLAFMASPAAVDAKVRNGMEPA